MGRRAAQLPPEDFIIAATAASMLANRQCCRLDFGRVGQFVVGIIHLVGSGERSGGRGGGLLRNHETHDIDVVAKDLFVCGLDRYQL